MNENNLARTIELIDLCFKLKEAGDSTPRRLLKRSGI